MKVICIHVDRSNDHDIPNMPHPALGETVTVIDESKYRGEKFFQFQEYSDYHGKKVWYPTKNFIEVSDIDETELVSEEYEEKHCVPVK